MLGALLAQFPISFKNTNANRDYLEPVLEKFKQYPLVVEVRHNSWTNEGTLRYFAEKGVAFCNIDQPKLGKAIAPTEHVTRRLATSACMDATTISGSTATRATTATTISTRSRTAEMEDAHRHHRREGQENLRHRQQSLRGQSRGQRATAEDTCSPDDPVDVPDTLLKKYWELGEISTRGERSRS